jgi:hypothetical protein
MNDPHPEIHWDCPPTGKQLVIRKSWPLAIENPKKWSWKRIFAQSWFHNHRIFPIQWPISVNPSPFDDHFLVFNPPSSRWSPRALPPWLIGSMLLEKSVYKYYTITITVPIYKSLEYPCRKSASSIIFGWSFQSSHFFVAPLLEPRISVHRLSLGHEKLLYSTRTSASKKSVQLLTMHSPHGRNQRSQTSNPSLSAFPI